MIRLVLDAGGTAFEQDIRDLCRAFYPGEEFEVHTPEGVHLSEASQEEKNALRLAREKGAEHSVRTGNGAVKKGSRVLTPEGIKNQEEIRLSLEIDTEELPLTGERSSDKTIIKRELYEILSSISGRELPWGSLTGIRPVSLASRRLSELSHKTCEELLPAVRRELSESYLIKGEKLELMLDIAVREQRLLKRIEERTGHSYKEGFSLYIGIPFCPSRCLYCSFTSNPIALWQDRLGDYFDCLRNEIRFTMNELCDRRGMYLQTIYIGGGTPTALDELWLERLMRLVEEECIAHPMTRLCEYTVEAGRPDSINRRKLQILKAAGVDRISINPQSFQQKTLDLIGRGHTVEQLTEAYGLARETGFDNINMDIILGLPGERLQELTGTLCEIVRRRPESLTVHSLAVKRAARLTLEKDYWRNIYRAGGDTEIKSDGFTEMERMMKASEYAAGLLLLKPYYLYRQKNMAGNLENVGFAAEGRECLYNILMMEEKHTVVGCGAGCSTKLLTKDENGGKRVERCDNGKDIRHYIENVGKAIERKRELFKLL